MASMLIKARSGSRERKDSFQNASKHFQFSESGLFNPENNPISPNRPMLFANFLKQKIGQEKFDRVLGILQRS